MILVFIREKSKEDCGPILVSSPSIKSRLLTSIELETAIRSLEKLCQKVWRGVYGLAVSVAFGAGETVESEFYRIKDILLQWRASRGAMSFRARLGSEACRLEIGDTARYSRLEVCATGGDIFDRDGSSDKKPPRWRFNA
jgi:hypothetical protein